MSDRERLIQERKEDAEEIRICYEFDCKGRVPHELLQLYNDYIELRISREEFHNNSLNFIKNYAQAGNNHAGKQNEIEMSLTKEQAEKLFKHE